MRRISKITAIAIATFMLFGLFGALFSQGEREAITITTYYPSPYGNYRELRARRMAVGPTYIDNSAVCWEDCPAGVTPVPAATNLIVEGNVGIGTTNPQSRLEVAAPNNPVRIGATGRVVPVEGLLDRNSGAINLGGVTQTNWLAWMTLEGCSQGSPPQCPADWVEYGRYPGVQAQLHPVSAVCAAGSTMEIAVCVQQYQPQP